MPSRVGFVHGTGAALNIELGFVPDYIRLTNLTDGTKVLEAYLGKVITFTSGGTAEIKKGDTIRGLTTTGATAKIREVILDSGSWAGGDAAGWFICDASDIVGTFTSETCEVNENGTDSVTVAAQTELGVDIDTEVAGITTVTTYQGDADNDYTPGVSIASGVSTNAKLFGYVAVANDPGMGTEAKVAGNTQAQAVW